MLKSSCILGVYNYFSALESLCFSWNGKISQYVAFYVLEKNALKLQIAESHVLAINQKNEVLNFWKNTLKPKSRIFTIYACLYTVECWVVSVDKLGMIFLLIGFEGMLTLRFGQSGLICPTRPQFLQTTFGQLISECPNTSFQFSHCQHQV